MVSVNKIEQGLANYIDAELMPQVGRNGLEKVLIGTTVSLFIRRSGSIIESYKDNKMVRMLGIMDEDGNVDVDTLVEELKKNISKDGVKVELPVIGTLTFHKEDIDKLYDYVMV